MEGLLTRYQVDKFPTTVFVGSSGKLIKSLVGASLGYFGWLAWTAKNPTERYELVLVIAILDLRQCFLPRRSWSDSTPPEADSGLDLHSM